MKHTRVQEQVLNERNKSVSGIDKNDLLEIHHFYLAAEQALATTALKKPEPAQRGSHSTRSSRRGASRGSKFSSIFFSL